MKPLYTQEQFDDAKTYDLLTCECCACNNMFETTKHNINSSLKKFSNGNKAKYCSSKCSASIRIKKYTFNCSQCGCIIEKNKSEISKSGNNFCSRSCSVTYNNTHKTTGNRRSKLEIYLEQELTKLYPNHHILFNKKETINSELDIHFVDLKLAFELNGIFHYEPIFGQDKLNQITNNDNRKFQACIENGIELCIIDSSSLKNFKEKNAKKYLDIIINIINKKGFNMSKNL